MKINSLTLEEKKIYKLVDCEVLKARKTWSNRSARQMKILTGHVLLKLFSLTSQQDYACVAEGKVISSAGGGWYA